MLCLAGKTLPASEETEWEAARPLAYRSRLREQFIGHPDQRRIFDELVGLPEDVVPIGLALIGKPGDVPPVGSRLKERQRAPEALVHWQQW